MYMSELINRQPKEPTAKCAAELVPTMSMSALSGVKRTCLIRANVRYDPKRKPFPSEGQGC